MKYPKLRGNVGENRVRVVPNTSTTAWLSVTLVLTSILSLNTHVSANSLQENKMARSKVVIIGAGVSGLATANMLMRNGLTDILILEAQDRIGGRVHYKQLGNNFGGVDLGGHWIHGEKGNAVYDLAEPLGLIKKSGDYSESVLVRLNGSEVIFNNSLTELTEIILDGVEHAAKEGSDSPNMQELVNQKVAELGKSKGLTEEDITALQLYLSRVLCILESCEDLSQVSLKSANEFEEFPGDHLIQWANGGMSNILSILMGSHEKSPWKGLDVENKVVLNSRVKYIDWSSDDIVNVTTETGLAFTADFVVVTPSLNVLKRVHESMFKPPLPKSKVDALMGIEMGVVDKVYLVYEKPWWPINQGLYFVPFHVNKYSSENQDLGDAIISITTENHNPKVLGAWFIGKGAKKMETLTDLEVMNVILKMLKQLIGKRYDITQPDMIVRSGWWNNQDVGGSYSYNSVKGDHLENPRGSLAEPLSNQLGKPMILFAGEATNRQHYSTVHGALETGWREAQRIIDYLKK